MNLIQSVALSQSEASEEDRADPGKGESRDCPGRLDLKVYQDGGECQVLEDNRVTLVYRELSDCVVTRVILVYRAFEVKLPKMESMALMQWMV